MNEVTRIHLGRQSYTIAVEAHANLKTYLDAIERKVHDKEVVNEVELRMSELLTERGVTTEKVILAEDVEYLQGQLGNPNDFSEDDEAPNDSATDENVSKKFFRDTDNALIAGVAAGIANYFGTDATLVRIIFVLLTIFGGGLGIVLYLVLWVAMPPAQTASEKLQMHGKPVTLEALKKSVDATDINGVAKRVNNKVLPAINGAFRVVIKLVGVGLFVTGLAIVSFVSVTKVYMLLHDNKLFQEDLFPVGSREHWLVAIVMGLSVIFAVFLMLAGVQAFKRKWPISGWLTGILLALFLLGSIASIALMADAAPRVRERYETSLRTTAIKDIQPFTSVQTTGEIDVAYVSSPNYAVNAQYLGNPNLSKLNVHVANNVLYIDSTELDTSRHCTMLCLFPRYNMTVQVHAPNIEVLRNDSSAEFVYPNE